MAAGHSYDEMKKEYMKVIGALAILTFLTVVAGKNDAFFAGMFGHDAGVWVNLAIGLIIATVKVGLVLYIFMHLKFDNKYLRAFIFIPVFLFFVLNFALNVLGP